MDTSQRRLRSKKLRAALYYAADGRCQRCGKDLPPEWHADHIKPWCRTGRTDVNEMQALCPPCNTSKGSTTMELRKHQRIFQAVMEAVVADRSIIRRVVALVTPGGGKSLLPVLLAHYLTPRFVDRVCWVVPRLALKEQAARSFLNPEVRNLLGHDMEIREAENRENPSRGTSGYVATYQAIGASPWLHEAEFSRRRYALILDEPHHVAVGGEWEKPLRSLVDGASFVLMMSGTMNRWDEQPVAFLPYRDVDGGRALDLRNTEDTRVIEYTLRDALNERAIIPAYFNHGDSNASWVDGAGEAKSIESLANAGTDTPAALWTALNTQYSTDLLGRAFEDWRNHRAATGHGKLLVVASTISAAKRYTEWFKARGVAVEVATSEDSREARRAIKKFKRGEDLNVLVTVAMAYEGLDVPAISHIACLTHIRSTPWIEQMIHRATRYNPAAGPYREQSAHIWVPDDREIHRCIQTVKEAQDQVIPNRPDEGPEGPGGDGGGEGHVRGSIIPLSSGLTRERGSDLGTEESVEYDEAAHLNHIMREHGLHGSPLQFRRAVNAVGVVVPSPAKPAATGTGANSLTVREREERLREAISKTARRYALSNGLEVREVNAEIYSVFGKSRTKMTEAELRRVWEYCQSHFSVAS